MGAMMERMPANSAARKTPVPMSISMKAMRLQTDTNSNAPWKGRCECQNRLTSADPPESAAAVACSAWAGQNH